jgi:hypothetical protein
MTGTAEPGNCPTKVQAKGGGHSPEATDRLARRTQFTSRGGREATWSATTIKYGWPVPVKCAALAHQHAPALGEAMTWFYRCELRRIGTAASGALRCRRFSGY